MTGICRGTLGCILGGILAENLGGISAKKKLEEFLPGSLKGFSQESGGIAGSIPEGILARIYVGIIGGTPGVIPG